MEKRKRMEKNGKRGRKERSMLVKSLQWNRQLDAARSYFTFTIDEKGCS